MQLSPALRVTPLTSMSWFWIETLPQASHNIPLAVRPGDSVTVSINEQSQGLWQIGFPVSKTDHHAEQHRRTTRPVIQHVIEGEAGRRCTKLFGDALQELTEALASRPRSQ